MRAEKMTKQQVNDTVIGQTTSGKPIYENHKHPAHQSFTSSEHGDAAKVQENLALDSKSSEASSHLTAMMFHRKEAGQTVAKKTVSKFGKHGPLAVK